MDAGEAGDQESDKGSKERCNHGGGDIDELFAGKDRHRQNSITSCDPHNSADMTNPARINPKDIRQQLVNSEMSETAVPTLGLSRLPSANSFNDDGTLLLELSCCLMALQQPPNRK